MRPPASRRRHLGLRQTVGERAKSARRTCAQRRLCCRRRRRCSMCCVLARLAFPEMLRVFFGTLNGARDLSAVLRHGSSPAMSNSIANGGCLSTAFLSLATVDPSARKTRIDPAHCYAAPPRPGASHRKGGDPRQGQLFRRSPPRSRLQYSLMRSSYSASGVSSGTACPHRPGTIRRRARMRDAISPTSLGRHRPSSTRRPDAARSRRQTHAGFHHSTSLPPSRAGSSWGRSSFTQSPAFQAGTGVVQPVLGTKRERSMYFIL